MKGIKQIRGKQEGFTLVEIIVVLVILAVLAAFTIPTMLGFVEEARAKAYIAEAREVYVAAQATATEWTAVDPSQVTNESLSSKNAYDAREHHPDITSPSLTMNNYLSEDMVIGSSPPPFARWKGKDGIVGWTVSLDGGKVTEVVYYKYEYKVTIDVGGSTSVEKPGYISD